MAESIYEPLERRPIQSRDTRWARAATQFLVRIGASPNAISLFGMFAAVIAGIAFLATSHTAGLGQRGLWICAAALCQVRLLCNLFDGMVAVGAKPPRAPENSITKCPTESPMPPSLSVWAMQPAASPNSDIWRP